METALQKLNKILDLERQGSYQNRAVIGGIQRYIPVWIEEARGQAESESEKVLVEQIAELLMDYGQLSGASARAKLVMSVQERLEKTIGTEDAPPVPAAAPRKKPAERRQPPRESAPKPAPAPTPVAPAEPEPEEAPPPAPTELPAGLSASITSVRGIGPRTAQLLEKLGLNTIHDLITFFPRRYVDYSLLKPINRLALDEQVTIIGTIWETSVQTGRNRQKVVRSIIGDGTATIQCTWFNQPWLADKLKTGAAVMVSGTVSQYLGRLTFNSPEWELVEKEQLHTGRIVPVYPLTAGLSAKSLRTHVKRTVDYWTRRIPDHLPAGIRQRQRLMSLEIALQQVHYPDNWDRLAAAQNRLAFDELFILQLGMLRLRQQWQAEPGIPLPVEDEWLANWTDQLPFPLTGAQQQSLEAIRQDLGKEVPMNRLLQGDVGSGKTVVAAAAIAIAVQAGAQAALMAPTEILAEQHAHSLAGLLAGMHIRLLTGSTPAAEKQAIYDELAAGAIDVVVGTHALIQEGVSIQKLGLVIVDEQHRFGVEQRAALRQKGHNPHMLVMTATPIPRTLALSLYGDLDISIIDEMPPGRQAIETYWLKPGNRERAYNFIRNQVAEGRQAFIICPLVEATDNSEEKAATDEHKRLQKQVFPDLRLGLLHGRLKSDEKEAAMSAFYRAETDVLVSTSVVEVGIDVPNATVMLVEGANRFGLSQLHQFRGRVGRGKHKSTCILLADSTTAEAEERLTAMVATNDGFVLAEKDLELRGPGEFFGTRQSGLPDLKMASVTDVKILEQARAEALTLFEHDPSLENPEHRLLAQQVDQFWSGRGDVS